MARHDRSTVATGMSNARRPPPPVSLTLPDVPAAARHLATFGYVVLPAAFDARPLADEIDRVLADALVDADHHNTGSAGNRFRYAPMMVAGTPVSLSLTLQLGALASAVLGAPVVPGRAKGTEYAGITGWHRDTELAARSIGCLAYLETLTARTGALWVLPGSHHAGYADAIVAADEPELPGVALPTAPGDVIVLDERLFHCSKGGGRRRRRQWRVDFLADDPGAEARPRRVLRRAALARLGRGLRRRALPELRPRRGGRWTNGGTSASRRSAPTRPAGSRRRRRRGAGPRRRILSRWCGPGSGAASAGTANGQHDDAVEEGREHRVVERPGVLGDRRHRVAEQLAHGGDHHADRVPRRDPLQHVGQRRRSARRRCSGTSAGRRRRRRRPSPRRASAP